MGRYAEKFTEQQRQAVGSAMIDPHPLTGKTLTAPEAVDKLNAGQLGCPAPAQPMSRTYAYGCRDKERRRRAGHELTPTAKQALEDPAAAQLALLQRVVSVHETLLAKLEVSIANDKPDLRLYPAVVRNQVQVQALLRTKDKAGPRSQTAKQQATNSKPNAESEETGYVTDLLAAHKQSRSNGAAMATDSSGREHSHSHAGPALALASSSPSLMPSE